MLRIIMIILFVPIFTLTGCTEEEEKSVTKNPTPYEFLQNENADIFLLEDTVFSNAINIEWVQEEEYTIGEEIGEISFQSNEAKDFENGTANKLPVGTKIYETDTQVFIAIVENREIPYLQMVEG
ncbi:MULTISPECIES: hypothetical protein [Oceanobacillus]|uniref:Lipoprotein n=1 Tax=Oceanobacillus kimchii TaxID=746691 RepID=A0ABQ5THG1_9BACI|nr:MULTISPECIES: hypothetical protein [Oceanobacillus]MCT1577723.1 hypothetical protein [Oceanobacillus kimchii]MCT2136711.1 hypothetical protein [Oceanobacillus kimchii]GLO64555.1 hypothetical protein MACH08_03390 [Oceanobacillus kimchii]